MLDGPGLLFLTLTSVLFSGSGILRGRLSQNGTNRRKKTRFSGRHVFHQHAGYDFYRMPAGVSNHNDARYRQPAPGPLMGGDGSDHTGQRSAHLLPSPSPIARSHLEISAHLVPSASPWPCWEISFWSSRRSKTNQPVSLLLNDLLTNASELNIPWLKAAFLLFLVGYGTKMGLAPMHTWLPDAHSESPSVVSALLSGALLNCALLGILRVHQICLAAGQADFSRDLLVMFGLISIGWATVLHFRPNVITNACSPIRASNTWGSSLSESAWAALPPLEPCSTRLTTRSPKPCSS